MNARKFGMNEYSVFVVKPRDYSDPKLKCLWLGQNRYQCGNCKKGYFTVKTDIDHEDKCPECKYEVVIRWQG